MPLRSKWIKANLGGNANVVVFNAAKIAQTLIPRTTGRIDALKKGGPGIKIVANQGISLLTPEEGSKAASTLMQAHPEINVWLGDDDTIVGVESALMAMGKKPTDKIYLSGFNGQANALARLQAGGLFREDIAFPNGVYEWATGQFLCDYIEGKSDPAGAGPERDPRDQAEHRSLPGRRQEPEGCVCPRHRGLPHPARQHRLPDAHAEVHHDLDPLTASAPADVRAARRDLRRAARYGPGRAAIGKILDSRRR